MAELSLVRQPSFFLTTAEAAEMLRLSTVTLSRWRVMGCGPVYAKIGGRVVYPRSSIEEWTEQNLMASTSAALFGQRR